MADAHMPDEFYDIAVDFLPPEEPPAPDGGRPRIDHRTALRVIWYVLVTGVRWRDVSPEMGCSGETARCRLRDWEGLGIWDALHHEMLRSLRRDGELEHETAIIDSTHVRAFGGGEKTGPSPVFTVR